MSLPLVEHSTYGRSNPKGMSGLDEERARSNPGMTATFLDHGWRDELWAIVRERMCSGKLPLEVTK